MSEATTGVPAANASVSTMPKLSPPSDGAHEQVGRARAPRAFVASSETLPSTRDARSAVEQQRLDLLGRRRRRSSSSTGDVLAQRLEGAQQHRQALALDGLADEDDPQRRARRPRRGAGELAPGTSTPLGMTR